MHNNKNLLATLALSAGLTASMSLSAGPGATNDSTSNSPKQPNFGSNFMLPIEDNSSNDNGSTGTDLSKQFNYLGQGKKQEKGLFSDKLEISGVARFLTIYRQMNESYVDMSTSDKNISFTDYPNNAANSGANAGFPLVEINLRSREAKKLNFNVGYSLGHAFTGNLDEASQSFAAVQNLRFSAQIKTGKVKTSLEAGEVIWTSLSRFTMGQAQYQDNYFERLPWDWYRTSFARYQEYFTLSSNIGAQNLGRTPIQGGIAVIEHLPTNLSLKAVFGQSNRSIIGANYGTGFPSYIHAYRLEKYIFERAIRGKAGLNFFQKRAYTAPVGNINDNNTIGTFDFGVKVKKINFSGEVGGSMIDNPDFVDANGDLNDNTGFGAVFKTEFDRRAVLWPFSVEFYHITKNFASVDGSILNSNPSIKQGGYVNETIYDDSWFANVSQEAGQIANNRRGVNLDLEANLGDFKVQLGYSASQEIEKTSDTIMIQHRVNSFSRSRFRPWFMAGGPYARIRSVWFRTYETLTLTNPVDGESGSSYLNRDLLGFNAYELTLKYKKKLNKKNEIVLINYTAANTISDGFNVVAMPGQDDVVASLIYNDFTAAFKINKKLSVIGNFAIERMKGSTRTDLSPDKADAPDEERIIDQTGTMYAIGADYDFSRKVSLHLRTKYMDHEDANFTKDKFNGLETTFELKIFF